MNDYNFKRKDADGLVEMKGSVGNKEFLFAFGGNDLCITDLSEDKLTTISFKKNRVYGIPVLV